MLCLSLFVFNFVSLGGLGEDYNVLDFGISFFKFSFLSFWTFPSHLCEMKQVEGSLLKVRENFMRYYQIIQKLHCLFLYFKNKVDIIFIPIYMYFKIVIVDDWHECIFLCLWLMDKHIE